MGSAFGPRPGDDLTRHQGGKDYDLATAWLRFAVREFPAPFMAVDDLRDMIEAVRIDERDAIKPELIELAESAAALFWGGRFEPELEDESRPALVDRVERLLDALRRVGLRVNRNFVA